MNKIHQKFFDENLVIMVGDVNIVEEAAKIEEEKQRQR